MKETEEARVERISGIVGGRFRLTTLVQKRMRDFHKMGRAFMPTVRNFDELFNVVLDEVEQRKLELILPEGLKARLREGAAQPQE